MNITPAKILKDQTDWPPFLYRAASAGPHTLQLVKQTEPAKTLPWETAPVFAPRINASVVRWPPVRTLVIWPCHVCRAVLVRTLVEVEYATAPKGSTMRSRRMQNRLLLQPAGDNNKEIGPRRRRHWQRDSNDWGPCRVGAANVRTACR